MILIFLNCPIMFGVYTPNELLSNKSHKPLLHFPNCGYLNFLSWSLIIVIMNYFMSWSKHHHMTLHNQESLYIHDFKIIKMDIAFMEWLLRCKFSAMAHFVWSHDPKLFGIGFTNPNSDGQRGPYTHNRSMDFIIIFPCTIIIEV